MKKKAVVIGIIFVAIVSVVFLASQVQKEPQKAHLENVAVIYLQGPIAEGQDSLFGVGGITPRYVESQLARASQEDSVKAVVLRVNSPGGSVGSSQEIASMIKDFEKPVVISMGDIAASGGYYISAPAEGIVAKPGTITGSIGVINVAMNLEDLYEKLGIEVEIIKSGEHKDMFHRSLTEDERELMQELSDEAYGQFVDEIVKGRNLDKDDVKEVATGELLLGSQAKQHGLIDRLGGLNDAVQYAGEIAGLDNAVKYEFPPPTFFETLTRFTAQLPEIIKKLSTPYELRMLEILEKVPEPELRYIFDGGEGLIDETN